MYKFIAGILALICCLALAGCGGGDSSSESSGGDGSPAGDGSSAGGMNIHEMWTDDV